MDGIRSKNPHHSNQETILTPLRRKESVMNQALRWKAFVSWWDREFPAQSNFNKKYTASQVVNMIEDKVFELKHPKKEPSHEN